MGATKRCIDCEPGTRRKASYPGPRCYTHHKAKGSTRKAARRAKHVEDTYGISEEQYQEIYRAQGGVCAGCRRARGTGKYRLAVDHDHSCCPGPIVECGGTCVRGLLCRSCNRDVLGHLRDSIDLLIGFIEYLLDPPAQRVLGFSKPRNFTLTQTERLLKLLKRSIE